MDQMLCKLSKVLMSSFEKRWSVVFKSFYELEVYQNDKLKVHLPRYARFGGQEVLKFEQAIANLEGGTNAIATCSGLSAITTVLTAIVAAGDHILVTCNAYGSTQSFCKDVLSKFGVSITYFDPGLDGDLISKIRANTKLLFIESPGSIDMAMTDIESVVSIAKSKNITTVMDNTWATPLLFRPMEHGVDIVIHSATKYISGNSSCVLGVIVCGEKHFAEIRSTQMRVGVCAGISEIALALAGLATLQDRMNTHYLSALKITKYLESIVHPAQIHFPPMEGRKQFHLWRKYFKGGNGLISLSFDIKFRNELIDFINNLNCFSLGFGWGGSKSMVMLYDHRTSSATTNKECVFIRFSIGLEPVEDLIADLRTAFSKTKYDFF